MTALKRTVISRKGVLIASMLALNCVGPALIAYSFFSATDSVKLEGAYLGGVLIGQPLAMLTIAIAFVVFARLWPEVSDGRSCFAVALTVTTLPAIALMVWPQISITPFWMVVPALLHTYTWFSWIASICAGVVVLGAMYFSLALAVARRSTRALKLRVAMLAGLAAPVLIGAPIVLSMAH